MRRFFVLFVFLFSAIRIMAAGDGLASVMAHKESGLFGSPTNFLYANLLAGSNIVLEPIGAGRLKIHGAGTGGAIFNQLGESNATHIPILWGTNVVQLIQGTNVILYSVPTGIVVNASSVADFITSVDPRFFEVIAGQLGLTNQNLTNWANLGTNVLVAINPTDGFIPARGSATQFTNSPFRVIAVGQVGLTNSTSGISQLFFQSSNKVASIGIENQFGLFELVTPNGMTLDGTGSSILIKAGDQWEFFNGILTPGTSNTYSLGQLARPFKDLFLGTNSFYLGTNKYSDNGTALIRNGIPIGAGSTPASANETFTSLLSSTNPAVWKTLSVAGDATLDDDGTNLVITATGGSQTPWTSDIDGNQNLLTNVSSIAVQGITDTSGSGAIATNNSIVATYAHESTNSTATGNRAGIVAGYLFQSDDTEIIAQGGAMAAASFEGANTSAASAYDGSFAGGLMDASAFTDVGSDSGSYANGTLIGAADTHILASGGSIASGVGNFGNQGQIKAYLGSIALGVVAGAERIIATNGSLSIGQDVVSVNPLSWTFGLHFTNATPGSFAVGWNAITNFMVQTNGNTQISGKISLDGTTNLVGVNGSGQITMDGVPVTSQRVPGAAPTVISPFPASTVNWTNTTANPIEVYLDFIGVTGTSILKNGTQILGGLVTGYTMILLPGDYFSSTYSVGTPVGKFSSF